MIIAITKLVTGSVSSADVFVMYQETTNEKWRGGGTS